MSKAEPQWSNLKPQRDALFHLFPTDTITTVVEIGVDEGGWIAACLTRIPREAIVYGIDPWDGRDSRHRVFQNRLHLELSSGKVIEIRKTSIAAAKIWDRPIDVLHIDGDHTTVFDDLLAWVPKVREGGLVCGHDVIGHRQSTWVYRDLRRYFGKLMPFFIGPIRGHTLGQALRVHSFWFYKDTPYGQHHSMRRKRKEKADD